jgi:hypothetical protein
VCNGIEKFSRNQNCFSGTRVIFQAGNNFTGTSLIFKSLIFQAGNNFTGTSLIFQAGNNFTGTSLKNKKKQNNRL